ncbi:hypothetical protein [Prevotella veroralis]|uniref:Uncharacterized protein n=1 Tax=Prevotella veroralis F0319 TaxID=649761 RepID=C9MT74_9BACT|nr:hypothetical protein [Prevotella veroralis]EEX17269.1 hypothetical protein HMPREF0973_02845 [Prevotella veroralis F0319]QUB40787.1 hypothetical protein J5A55_00490 [Prevotella veroralis]
MEKKISDLTISEFTKLMEETFIKVLESKSKRPLRERGVLPEELQSDFAKSVLKRGIRLKILGTDYMPLNGVTRYQLKEFADLASELLGIKRNKWSIFESFWGLRNMSQIRQVEANIKEMEKIWAEFPELGYGKMIRPKGFVKVK